MKKEDVLGIIAISFLLAIYVQVAQSEGYFKYKKDLIGFLQNCYDKVMTFL